MTPSNGISRQRAAGATSCIWETVPNVVYKTLEVEPVGVVMRTSLLVAAMVRLSFGRRPEATGGVTALRLSSAADACPLIAPADQPIVAS